MSTPLMIKRREAFTLVELLVVITILAILASMVLFALASATESAREAKTKSTIKKLDAIVMTQWESYRARRVPIDAKKIAANKGYIAAMGETPGIAYARLQALREMMRFELPDSYRDIEDAPISGIPVPAAALRYRSKLPPFATRSTQHIGAKCLYLIATSNPDALEQFTADEIATDVDGTKYFVDGWGHPIYFLRWAPAYQSPLQTPGTQHDPFDPLNTCAKISKINQTPKRLDENTFPLTPLIYSAGSDGIYDIAVDPAPPATGISYADPKIQNDPFTASIVTFVGVAGPAAVDNLTNHE